MTKPPRHWIEHSADWRTEPLAYWVHVAAVGEWRQATEYSPPAPAREGMKGFRVLCVEAGDTVLRFSSEAQLREFIRVLSLKRLPTTRQLSDQRGSGLGPNSHWLSRLPADLKSPRRRALLVKKLATLTNTIGT